MKQKNSILSSWPQSILIVLTILLVVIQPLAPVIPQAAVARAEDPLALQLYSAYLGGDGYIGVPYSTELNYMGALTIEAWVFRNNTNRSETVVGNGWQDSYWMGFSSTGKLRLITHDGLAIDSNTTVAAGEWTHVAVTYSGVVNANMSSFYINGALDKYIIQYPGAIAPNPGNELQIGHDTDLFVDNYFDGMIDEVRIWNTVRTSAQIQASMFQNIPSPLPASLVAYWHLNGDASDVTGDHDGTTNFGMGSYFANNGGLPKDIRIPQVTNTPILDGSCGPTEYASATAVSVEGVVVNLQHTATDLWACFDLGTLPDYTRARLLLDPTHDRLDPAQKDDIRLQVQNDNALTAYAGNETGSWVITDTYNTLWSGHFYTSGGEFPTYSAEFRVGSSMVGGWGHVIGLALDPYIPGPPPYNFDQAGIWPALAVSNQPSTWSSATLAGTGPTRLFSGSVQYQPKNPNYDPTGVQGAKVELYGYDLGGSEALAATATSANNGNFSLTTNDDFTYHRLELNYYPQGYTSVSAEAPSPGTVLDARTIDYGNAGGGSYLNIIFTLADTVPYNVNAAYGPVFLIIAPQAVISTDALDAFVTFKSQQGYAVSIRSVEEADALPGATRLERVRALEQDYLTDYGNRFQFVMLIGGNDVIPFAKITPYATGEKAVCPTDPDVNYKYSDWLYVDLTSNWDSNGNGCYADGALTDPDKLVASYTPDTGIAFDPTVVLGRIPFSQPETIREVLKTSIGFEKQSESYKLKAINGMSHTALKGYFYGVACTRDNWDHHCVPPVPNNESNYDFALLSEEMKYDYLNANGFDTTILYENEEAVAGGQGINSPVDLTRDNFRDALGNGRFGLASMLGHGSASGVYRDFWSSDLNGNGVVDIRDDAQTELSELTFFDIGGVLNSIDPDGSRGSVFVMLACSNATPTNASNIAATILSDGHGPASIGGLSVTSGGSWFNENDSGLATLGYYLNKRLVSENYRLGESVWWTLADLIYQNKAGSGGVAYDLYGDPTLSFFGNSGGQTTLAAWPMGRRDPSGASYLTLPGPTYPKKLWEYTAEMHTADTYGPTPLVSANGEIIVASGTHVDVLRQGALYQRLDLDGYVFGSPALSADGTIYVMDQDANLYAFPNKRFTWNNHTTLLSERERRWKVDLGENPQASPIVGSDGFILAGIGGPDADSARLWVVRPDGQLHYYYALEMNPTYYAATDASRSVYVATYGDQGFLYRFSHFCDLYVHPYVCPYGSHEGAIAPFPFGTPPLLAYDSVYIGDVGNTLYKYDKVTLDTEATFIASGAIQMGPILSPNGDIVFITSQGVMYSITKDLATVRWQVDLGFFPIFGIPAASNNAIYMAFGGYLHAYNPNSGAQLWKRSLGGEISYASVSVGYGREVYVQGVTGKVLAFGEGWGFSPADVNATAILVSPRQRINIDIMQSLTPISPTLSLPSPSLPGIEDEGTVMAPAATVVAILLQRSENGGSWVDLAILSPDATGYTDTDIEPGASYAYRVQNLMSDGTSSDFETTADVVQSYPDLPAAPVLNPVDVDGSESLSLSWSPALNSVVDHYVLERSLSGGGPFTTIITLTGETYSTQDTGLTPGTTYYYQVRAVNGMGSSVPSNVESGSTRTQTLPAPQNFQATLESKTIIQLTWDAGPAGATAVIEINVFGQVGYSLLNNVPATDDAYILSIGEPGAYSFRIKFVQGDSESVYAYSSASLVIYETRLIYLPLMQR